MISFFTLLLLFPAIGFIENKLLKEKKIDRQIF